MSIFSKIISFFRSVFSAPVDAASLVTQSETKPSLQAAGEIVASDLSAQDVIESYLQERDGTISKSVTTDDKHPEFNDMLKAEYHLLQELKLPGNERIKILTILYQIRKSIHTVQQSIVEQDRRTDISFYFIRTYEKRMTFLKQQASALEKYLESLTTQSR